MKSGNAGAFACREYPSHLLLAQSDATLPFARRHAYGLFRALADRFQFHINLDLLWVNSP